MGECVIASSIREGAAEEAKSRQKDLCHTENPEQWQLNNKIDLKNNMFYGCLLGTQSNKYNLHQGRNVQFLLKLNQRLWFVVLLLIALHP